MTLEKLQKIAAAITASAVLLLFILISVMVYQMTVINAKKAEIDRLKAEIAVLEEEKKNTQADIDLWLSDWKIEERLRELGYIDSTDK